MWKGPLEIRLQNTVELTCSLLGDPERMRLVPDKDPHSLKFRRALLMSLEQASPFVRLVNIVRRSVYVPSRIDGLPQQVFTRHAQPLRTRDRISQLDLLAKVSSFYRRQTNLLLKARSASTTRNIEPSRRLIVFGVSSDEHTRSRHLGSCRRRCSLPSLVTSCLRFTRFSSGVGAATGGAR